jgi:putative ABC transport system permease protein
MGICSNEPAGALHGSRELQHAVANHLRRGRAGSGGHWHLRLMAYFVTQRTQEMGIRMALGADRSVIRKRVIWQGMRLTLIGVAMGIAVAFELVRLIASFLFGVKPWDLEVFVSVPLFLSSVALLAVWLPSRRASKLDPMQALRTE